MNKKWRKLLELSTLECLLLLFVLLLFPFIVVLLKKRGLRCTQSFLSLLAIPLFPYNIDGEDEPALILGQRIARIVQIGAAHGFIKAICLPRSLLLWWLLLWRGIETQVCIGVDKEDNGFHAHAWVEYQGIVINDDLDIRSRFMAFDLAAAS